MLLSKKTYVALLWGISVASAATETTSISSTAAAHNVPETTVPRAQDTIATSHLVAAMVRSTDPPLRHTTAAMKTTAGVAHPSRSTTLSKAAEDATDQQPPTDMTVAAPTTRHEVASKLSPTTSPATSSQAPVFMQTLSSPSASATPTRTTFSTSEAAPVHDPASTTSTDFLSTSQSITWHEETSELSPTTSPATSSQALVFIQTLSSPSASTTPTRTTFSTSYRTASSESTNSPVSTTNISSPHTPTRWPVPTTKSAVATAAPQPCSTRGVVKHCLIAIASLAAVATVFMVLTITLCTKLSARKYKVKKPQPATEMTCISSLLPDRSHGYSRQRNPVTNGVLVIHGGADSDEDGGDNLTLSSFLPENDRFV